MKKMKGLHVFRITLFCLLAVALAACSGRDEHKVERLADIAGSRVGVQLGSTSDLRATKYEGDAEGTDVERFTKTADAIQALLQGKIDCIVEDELPAKAFVRQNPGLRILPETFGSDEYAFCVAKDNHELKRRIDHALLMLRHSGTLDTIVARHIDQNMPVAYLPKPTARHNGRLVVATNARQD